MRSLHQFVILAYSLLQMQRTWSSWWRPKSIEIRVKRSKRHEVWSAFSSILRSWSSGIEVGIFFLWIPTSLSDECWNQVMAATFFLVGSSFWPGERFAPPLPLWLLGAIEFPLLQVAAALAGQPREKEEGGLPVCVPMGRAASRSRFGVLVLRKTH